MLCRTVLGRKGPETLFLPSIKGRSIFRMLPLPPRKRRRQVLHPERGRQSIRRSTVCSSAQRTNSTHGREIRRLGRCVRDFRSVGRSGPRLSAPTAAPAAHGLRRAIFRAWRDGATRHRGSGRVHRARKAAAQFSTMRTVGVAALASRSIIENRLPSGNTSYG